MLNNPSSQPIEGTLYVITAPSGTGKTTLVKRVLATTDGITVSISHTTRAPRPGEQPGVDYYFIDTSKFLQMVQNGDFLEHAQVFGYQYGTSYGAVHNRLRDGLDVILEIDWQGAQQVRRVMPQVCTIFIVPPSLETLRQRLQQRAQDTPAVIEQRLQESHIELSHCHEFDYIVINDVLEKAVEALRAIIISHRQRRDVIWQRYPDLFRRLLSG